MTLVWNLQSSVEHYAQVSEENRIAPQTLNMESIGDSYVIPRH